RVLGGRQQADGGRLAPCPAHEDKNPSFAYIERGGRLLVRCYAGCEQAALVEALRRRGLDITNPKATESGRWTLRDIDGTPLFVHVRYDKADGSKSMPWLTVAGEPARGVRTAELPLF